MGIGYKKTDDKRGVEIRGFYARFDFWMINIYIFTHNLITYTVKGIFGKGFLCLLPTYLLSTDCGEEI